MVVHDLDVVSIAFTPSEADAPPIVDPDAPLPGSIAAEALEAIPRWNPKIFQGDRRIELPQLAQGDALNVRPEPSNRPALEETPGVPVTEAPVPRP